MERKNLFKKVKNYCQEIEKKFDSILDARKAKLNLLSQYIAEKISKDEISKIIVICTHNSRRSHLGQVWLAVGSDYYGIPKVETFSGGTEATALNERVVRTLKEVGFDIEKEKEGERNPVYKISWVDDQSAYTAFSKKFDTSPNPTSNFAAIMVCSEADTNCPIVFGMDFRLGLPFDDPKDFDDTNLEEEKYHERCGEIAKEMLFVMHQVKSQIEL